MACLDVFHIGTRIYRDEGKSPPSAALRYLTAGVCLRHHEDVQPRAPATGQLGGSDRLGRLKEPGGMGPAAYERAQEGGDPVDIDQYAWTEVASS